MNNRTFLTVLFALATLLPGSANAQSDVEIRYPDGTVSQPLPVVPSLSPDHDVNVTSSIAPRATSAPASALAPQRGDVSAADRPGCDTQSYIVGLGQRVRVHRC